MNGHLLNYDMRNMTHETNIEQDGLINIELSSQVELHDKDIRMME